MTTQQPEALDLADWLEAVGGGLSAKRCAALLREQHAGITALESQLAQRFDAADMATAAAQGFRDGAAKEQQAGAFQAALDIRTAQGWKLGGDKVPVLYTDEINGQQVCRDDVWLCTTDAFTHPSPPDALVQNAVYALCGPFGGRTTLVEKIALASAPAQPVAEPANPSLAASAGGPVAIRPDIQAVLAMLDVPVIARMSSHEGKLLKPGQEPPAFESAVPLVREWDHRRACESIIAALSRNN